MKHFLEGLQNQITQYFLYMRWWFLIFFASFLLRKILSKFLLASMKSGDFTGSRIRFSNSAAPQREQFSLWKANSQSSACGFDETSFKFFWIFHHHLRLKEQFTESQAASWMPQQAFWRGFQ
jgi:hypothetical protein